MRQQTIITFGIVLTLTASTYAFAAVEAPSAKQPETATAATPAAPQPATRHVPIEGDFGEGWQQTVVLPHPSPSGAGGQVRLSIENGWLCVRHESSDGQMEWHIVLCQVEDHVLPEIEIMDSVPNFVDVSYRGGRYFVRDAYGIFRALRQVASDGNLLAKAALLTPDASNSGYGMSYRLGITCTTWNDNGWYFVASGQDKELWRAVVRLSPIGDYGTGKKGHGASVSASCIHEYYGDKWLIDDGELLVANRMSVPVYEAVKKEKAAREAILAGELPAIDATEWLNTDAAPTWDSLRGKVVLVDFWATWCGPCVANLPHVQKLHEDYGDRGLAVVGIHSSQDAETCEAFIKEQGYTFPVALDSGKTAEMFAISGWPSYFLIDRAGKVVQSFTHQTPSDEAVETLLQGTEP